MKQYLIILSITFSLVFLIFLESCRRYEEKSDMKKPSSSQTNEQQGIEVVEMKNLTPEKELNLTFRLDGDQLLFNWPIIFREVSKLTSPKGIGHCYWNITLKPALPNQHSHRLVGRFEGEADGNEFLLNGVIQIKYFEITAFNEIQPVKEKGKEAYLESCKVRLTKKTTWGISTFLKEGFELKEKPVIPVIMLNGAETGITYTGDWLVEKPLLIRDYDNWWTFVASITKNQPWRFKYIDGLNINKEAILNREEFEALEPFEGMPLISIYHHKAVPEDADLPEKSYFRLALGMDQEGVIGSLTISRTEPMAGGTRGAELYGAFLMNACKEHVQDCGIEDIVKSMHDDWRDTLLK
jgi:hypothetical protein